MTTLGCVTFYWLASLRTERKIILSETNSSRQRKIVIPHTIFTDDFKLKIKTSKEPLVKITGRDTDVNYFSSGVSFIIFFCLRDPSHRTIVIHSGKMIIYSNSSFMRLKTLLRDDRDLETCHYRQRITSATEISSEFNLESPFWGFEVSYFFDYHYDYDYDFYYYFFSFGENLAYKMLNQFCVSPLQTNSSVEVNLLISCRE